MMGMQTMQAQQPMQGGGKGSMMQPQQGGYPQQPRPMDMGMGMGQNQSAVQGMGQGMGQQARFGQPNRYSNTTQQQPWDNASINPQPSGKGMQSQQPMQGGGKSAGGKGAGMQQGGQMQGGGKGQAVGGYPTAATNFGQPTQTAAYPTAVTNFGTPNLLTSSLANTANTANTGLQNDQTYNELDYRNMGS